jgi:hypothetical protein
MAANKSSEIQSLPEEKTGTISPAAIVRSDPWLFL